MRRHCFKLICMQWLCHAPHIVIWEEVKLRSLQLPTGTSEELIRNCSETPRMSKWNQGNDSYSFGALFLRKMQEKGAKTSKFSKVLFSGMARVRLADLNGPKSTSSGQNVPKCIILVYFGLANAKIQFGIRSF